MRATFSTPRILVIGLFGCALAGLAGGADRAKDTAAPSPPHDRPAGELQLVASFDGPMPTGVTVSHTGRVFVNFPRWEDKVDFTVAELKDGKAVAFPDAEFNRGDLAHQDQSLVSVQSVVVDPKDRLWALDTGSINFGPVKPGGPKLVGIDLTTNKVFKTILFPKDVALPTTYLNDIRFDLRRGKEGVAFITDSAGQGPNGIIVVDLASGHSWRRLNDHPSTKAEKDFLGVVEGRQLITHEPGKKPERLTMGSDGIAIGADGKRLFYCPLAGRHLFSASADALADESKSDEEVAKTVQDHGQKPASDGMETDAEGRVYVTSYETNSVLRWHPDGTFDTVVHDPRLLWPDTLSLATDGHLYVTANQLHRLGRFHGGKDLRQKPYSLFRVKVDAKPVLLK